MPRKFKLHNMMYRFNFPRRKCDVIEYKYVKIGSLNDEKLLDPTEAMIYPTCKQLSKNSKSIIKKVVKDLRNIFYI